MQHAVERTAEKSMKRWLACERVSKYAEKKEVADRLYPYICVSRETEAGGTPIAKQVAEQLGWDFLDHEILDQLSEEYGLSASLLEKVDETKQNWFGEILSEWLIGRGYSQSAYVHRLGRHLMLAAHHAPFVVVGRGARFILPREHGLSIRIIAPVDFRIQQAVLHRGGSAEDAKRWILESDEDREDFVQKYFQGKSNDPHMYDLVINVEKMTQDDAVRLIVDSAKAWIEKKGIATDPITER